MSEGGDYSLALVSVNKNIEVLPDVIKNFCPEHVCICDESAYHRFRDMWNGAMPFHLHCGTEGLIHALSIADYDVCLNALVGDAGILPSLTAIQRGKDILLANKETMVVAGPLIMRECERHNVSIIPVDSEHSSIFQIIHSESRKFIHKVVITCSGGPFFGKKRDALREVSVDEALNHPVWKMGSKITLDSATLMNKGFELIEAHYLFGLSHNEMDVVVHPQAFVHAFIQYVDGTWKAVMHPPDMRYPIRYALSYPSRVDVNANTRVKLPQVLNFFDVDHETFPTVGLAIEAIKRGGNAGAILHYANDVAHALFLTGKIKFTDIFTILEEAMDKIPHIENPTLEDLIDRTRNMVYETFAELKMFNKSA